MACGSKEHGSYHLPPEDHHREQFYWSLETRKYVAEICDAYQSPCLLFLPSMLSLRPNMRVLDIDKRFDGTGGFSLFDAYRPQRPVEDPPYDLIVLDPPFDCLRLDQLFRCLRTLGATRCPEDGGPRVLMSYPRRREAALLATFEQLGLQAVSADFHVPRYCSVTDEGLFRDDGIFWYANWAIDQTREVVEVPIEISGEISIPELSRHITAKGGPLVGEDVDAWARTLLDNPDIRERVCSSAFHKHVQEQQASLGHSGLERCCAEVCSKMRLSAPSAANIQKAVSKFGNDGTLNEAQFQEFFNFFLAHALARL